MASDRWPATCDLCGARVDDFERARVHSRDLHGGIKAGMLDHYTPIDTPTPGGADDG